MSVQEIENLITQLPPNELDVLKAWFERYQPNDTNELHAAAQPVFTAENDPLVARMEARLAEALTDPDEIRAAEEEMLEFKRNMNAWRKEGGERLHYPEVEES